MSDSFEPDVVVVPNIFSPEYDNSIRSESSLSNAIAGHQETVNKIPKLSSEKMKVMKDRFSQLLLRTNDDDDQEDFSARDSTVPSETGQNLAPRSSTDRWQSLRQVISKDKNKITRPKSGRNHVVKSPNNNNNTIGIPGGEEDDEHSEVSTNERKIIQNFDEQNLNNDLMEEEEELTNYWDTYKIPDPIISHLDIELEEFNPPVIPEYESIFQSESAPMSLEVTKISEYVVEQQRMRMEKSLMQARLETIEKTKAKEMDMLWKEHMARLRVEELEVQSKGRISHEKAKIFELALEKDKSISRNFKRAREDLETHIQQQNATAREHFGELITTSQSLGRKLDIYTNNAPLPIEIRIHFLRAIKTKLEKGAYVVMVSQHDSLGGQPLRWSKMGPYGIGPDLPAVTKPAKHYGRYFDRNMKFEDSCFLSCPPKHLLKPCYVIILELFQLANRSTPMDKCVGWTAFPMCNEHFGVFEGNLKLPFIRGEHSPNCQSFRGMEEAMASDLNNWLCNAYIEVRHLPRTVLHEALNKKDFALEYDYFKKIATTNGLSKMLRASIKLRPTESHDNDSVAIDIPPSNNAVPPNNKALSSSSLLSYETQTHTQANVHTVGNIDKGLFRRNTSNNKSLAHADSAFELNFRDYKPGSLPTHVSTPLVMSASMGNNNSSSKSERRHPYAGMYMSHDSDDDFHMSSRKNRVKKRPLSVLNSMRSMLFNVFSSRPPIPAAALSNEDRDNNDGDGVDEMELGLVIHPTILKKPSSRNNNTNVNNVRSVSFSAAIDDRNNSRSVKMNIDDEIEEQGEGEGDVHSPLLSGISNLTEVDKSMKANTNRNTPRRRDTGYPTIQVKVKDKDREEEEVLERGYGSDEDFFLHAEQRGKLIGVDALASNTGKKFASAMNEGKIIRRHVSEGPRFDSEAINVHDDDDDGNNGDGGTDNDNDDDDRDDERKTPLAIPSKFSTGWSNLVDPTEIETYTMSIASDPSKRKRLLPRQVAKSKLVFLSMELFGDLVPHQWGKFDSYVTIFIYIIAIWMRMYVHYIAQYLFLQGAGTPVYGFSNSIYQLEYKYMSSSISSSVEVGVVAIGPIFNILIFLMLGYLGGLFYKVAGNLPLSCSKFIASYGVATALDPVLIAVVDILDHNYSCSTKDLHCQESYTSSSCHCFEGDMIKLYNRMLKDEGSGITGIFITAIVYSATITITLLLLYEYIVYVHRDARVLDLYRRINAPAEEFFMPDDHEISGEELRSICAMAKKYRSLDGSTRQLQVTTHVDKTNNDIFNRKSTKHYAIYECGSDGKKKSIYRHFIALEDGAILEIFEQFSLGNSYLGDATSNEPTSASAKLYQANHIEDILSKDFEAMGMGDGSNNGVGNNISMKTAKKFGIFAGLENI